MAITRIQVRLHEYDVHVAYQDYFEGPAMTNDMRHEIRNRIDLWRKGKGVHTNVTALIFHTMCDLGFHRVDAEQETFIVINEG